MCLHVLESHGDSNHRFRQTTNNRGSEIGSLQKWSSDFRIRSSSIEVIRCISSSHILVLAPGDGYNLHSNFGHQPLLTVTRTEQGGTHDLEMDKIWNCQGCRWSTWWRRTKNRRTSSLAVMKDHFGRTNVSALDKCSRIWPEAQLKFAKGQWGKTESMWQRFRGLMQTGVLQG